MSSGTGAKSYDCRKGLISFGLIYMAVIFLCKVGI